MERLKSMKDSLVACAQAQMGNLQNVDTKELGEAIDMIKDLEEAIYYCTITKAMEEKDKNGEHNQQMYPAMHYDSSMQGNNARGGGSRGYEEPIIYNGGYRYDPYLEEMMNKRRGIMYYNGTSNLSGGKPSESSTLSSSNTEDRRYPMEIRDAREGRSGVRRRFYMEAKEENHGTPAKMKELEEYLKELAEDVTEMIDGASPEEKAILQQKLVSLANKVKNV